MKKLHAARLGALALTLTLISTCLAGGTLARYTSEVTGTGTANIAKWSVAFKQGTTFQTADYNFNLHETKKENGLVSTNTIAPGDTGEIKIEINGSGSEVAFEYKIELDNLSNLAENTGNIKFYSDAECKNAWPTTPGFTTVALGDVSTPVKKSIYWKWEGGEDNNAGDTNAGKEAAKGTAAPTFTVKLTAQQSLASSPTS
ncbi:hypothetical protein V3C10_07465 [[Clostridium] symbiosum]|uniref:hypothetical protein n=1 Tax=Clostridium symbiosum TaxID=1512 RepID=UPI001D09338E|nr:hypothetical protein [[Clostridium] symbiosum]MCB6607208.1 hypothetical protein [[Clostridium] symbiosum]MCB6929768.1 hypothetical protein [[Clostridium] symbiosum]